MTYATQSQAILEHLQSGRTITPIEALNLYGVFRLGARIFDLKDAGHNIVNEWDGDGEKRWAKYRLIPPAPAFREPVQISLFEATA